MKRYLKESPKFLMIFLSLVLVSGGAFAGMSVTDEYVSGSTIEWTWDGCLPGFDPVEYCEVHVEGDDVYVTHYNDVLNCCIDEVGTVLEVEPGLITITEYEIYYIGPCYCLCNFDVDMVVEDVPPGIYTLEVYTDYNYGPPELKCSHTVKIGISELSAVAHK